MKDGIRKALTFLLCLSLVIGSVAYRPQRVEAVGLTASAIVVSGIVAVMAACGVTIAAQTESGMTDYITEKLDDYFQTLATVPQSILEWLELESPVDVFTVLTSGQLRFTRPVANKILDFLRWFNTDEGVQSGGQTVGVVNDAGYYLSANVNAGTTGDVLNGDYILFSATSIVASLSDCLLYYWGDGTTSYRTILVYLPQGTQNSAWKYTYNNGVVSYRTAASSPSLDSATGYYYTGLGRVNTDVANSDIPVYLTERAGLDAIAGFTDGVEVTPSQTVAVPLDVPEGATLDISTNATISDGDTVEEAAQAIFDVVQSDGLTSDATLDSGSGSGDTSIDLSGILDALADILAAIINGPSTIINGIQNLISTPLTNIINGITGLPNAIQSALSTPLTNIINGISGLPNAIQSALSTFFTTVIGRLEALPNAIRATFDTILGDIKNRITSLPTNIASEVRNLFVPSADFMDTYVDSLYQSFASRVGLLTYPLALTESFLMRFLTARYTDPVISWAAVREPFSGQILIQAGSYNFNSMLQDQQIARVHDILLVVVKAGMAFALFELCRKKYNAIIYGEGS